MIHGTPDSFWYNDGSAKGIYLNQRQLTNYLKSKGITPEENIRLISCESGALENGIAQDFANKMGTNVLAPTTKVITFPDGSLVLGDYDAATRTVTVEGTWNLFSPGNESVSAVYSADNFANINYLKRYFNVVYKK